jgi:hypothetical protein
MRVMGGGRPVTKAIIGARRSHGLNGANRKKEEKQNTCRGTHHEHVAPKKSASPYHDEYHIRNCLGSPSKSSGTTLKVPKDPMTCRLSILGASRVVGPHCCVLSLVESTWWDAMSHGRQSDQACRDRRQYFLRLSTLPLLLDKARLLRGFAVRAAWCDRATRQRNHNGYY